MHGLQILGRRWSGLLACLAIASPTWAVDVQGVLPASMDQPRIYLAVSRGDGPPLAAKGEAGGDALAALMGEKPDKNRPPTPNFTIEAFLDTGASGTMLAKSTADALGVKAAVFDGKPITFYDVGVAGKEAFGVTEPLRLRCAEYSGKTDGTDIGQYAAPLKAGQLKTRSAGGILEQLGGALDIAGTPLMQGRVMVVDCRPVAEFDKLRTRLLMPGDKEIPKPDVAVPLSMVDFDRFTQTEPKNAPKVDSAPNPMVGPNPFDKTDRTQPVTIGHKGKTTTLTMLLDTGSAATMISVAKAKAIGIEIGEDGKIKNIPAKDQFSLPIGGIGGSADVAGCFIDSLQLPSTAGEPIRYVKTPVLIKDITVIDEATGESFTLDGVLGMNYLVASASVSGGMNAGVEDIHDGPFSFFFVDFPRKTLGLKMMGLK
ncbi:MAG: hypothetical protein JWM57_2947 [Phycisphaerales bacterium]|nr:hypothetical protein [Phycisphaerales bacterium]